MVAGGALPQALSVQRPIIVHVWDAKPDNLETFAIDEVSKACRNSGAAAVLCSPKLLKAFVEEHQAERQRGGESVKASKPSAKEAGQEGTRREAGRAIEKNRGLTRERKKIDANPRVKNREKFRKATIRRKGAVRGVQDAGAGPYSGELTGIKKNVTHSTRFKTR